MDASEEQQGLKRQNDVSTTAAAASDPIPNTHTPVPEQETDMPDVPQSPPHKKTKFIALGPDTETAVPEGREVTPTPLVNTNIHLPIPNDSSLPPRSMASSPSLQIELIDGQDGKAPTRGSAFSAGYDLYSSQDTVIPARGRAVVKTGIKIAVPAGTYGRVAPRSGLAVKHGIDTGAGVIDADYRGEVGVVLFNFSDEDFEVKKHDRIAQLVLEKIVCPEVEVVTALSETVRGAGGFGSTGGFGKQV